MYAFKVMQMMSSLKLAIGLKQTSYKYMLGK